MVATLADPGMARLQKLLRHVEHVQQDTQFLGVALIERGEAELGRSLIAHGLQHDASKFTGIEWESLGSIDQELHRRAWEHHVRANTHHPEAWESSHGAGDGIHAMSRVAVAEMLCDWHARSSEFATGLTEWIDAVAMERFGFRRDDPVGGQIEEFLSLLIEPRFA